MKAILQDIYGGPDMLRLADVPTPEPRRGEVQLRVLACGANLSDWEGLTGRPAYARLGGLRRPRRKILGSDVVGEVIGLGEAVEGFALGQRVMGDVVTTKGGFAEVACGPAAAFAPVPDALDDVTAAALPQPGAIAVQGMAGVGPGTRVLINGAGGGSGTLAVQIARAAGAHVTAVDSAAKLDWLRGIGADEVLDYRAVDWAATGRRWDLILDMVATRPGSVVARALAPGGTYRAVGGPVRTLLPLAVGRLWRRGVRVLAVRAGREVTEGVAAMAVAGILQPVVAGTVGLDGVADLLGRVGRGEVRGKAVVVP
ncbi:quinone oxidoreductase family protein [Wenxinia marina]|uniref:NADPH:quinone reductase n=1 Tax=Wenxinia marina DSM 24838 TaxID=1123501 RepID=A0A0D0Q7F0_9RHOB|nr:NAD(P)-dependent alcohol dehydrogenase [Wenxinia marina]KIQ70369.1 NADPH:quinone reductase [Wenxinia marina DSM 24838]GGL53699.1 NADPH:quinone reductase [Wenxinia marina]